LNEWSSENRTIMRKAVDDSIQYLGGRLMKTVLTYLRYAGIDMESDAFDLRHFDAELAKLVGTAGSDLIMNLIFHNLCQQKQGQLDNINSSMARSKSTPIEKIEKLLEVKGAN